MAILSLTLVFAANTTTQNIGNKSVRKIYFLLGVLLLAFARMCLADECGITSPLFQSVSLGNVLVQRDTPPGAEIARVRASGFIELTAFSPTGVVNCQGGYTFNYLSATPAAISGVYNTNLAGVGIKVSVDAGNFILPSRGANIKTLYYVGNYDVILYKTGEITPGLLTPGLVATGWYDSPENEFMRISLGGNNQVSVLACSLTSQVINFNLGDINASEFSERPGFIPAYSDTQHLGLNCDPAANINVELVGTQNPDAIAEPGVLALNGQGNPGIADGVGIQFIYNGIPLQVNNRIVLKRSAGGQEMFPLTARYYQTKAIVKPGRADATATLNITYQ